MIIKPGVTATSEYRDFGTAPARRGRPLRIRAQAILLSVVPVAFLLILLSIALLIQQVTIESGDWSKRSEQNLSQSARLIAGLTAANRAISAYSLKHHKEDLDKYDRAARSVPADIAKLESLAMTPGQRKRARSLGASVIEGMRVLETFRRLQISGKTEQAKALAINPSTQALGLKIQRDTDAFDTAQRELTLQHISAMRAVIWRYELGLIACCILGILCSLYMTVRFGFSIVRRLHRLELNVQRLDQGEYSEPIAGTDEIATLDRAYHAMTRRVEQERAVASLLQRALLPQNMPNISGIRLDTAYMPAAQETEVGGDWYDVFELSPKLIGISIGDVGGHGVRAAAVMGAARQAIRTAAYIESDPAQVLHRVNRETCTGADSTPVTAFFATLDLTNGAFRYAVAGHPLPLVMTPGGDVETLSGDGLMLGVDPGAEFESTEGRLQNGCGLLLYTDGVIENTRNYVQGMTALTEALRVEGRSSRNVAQAILERVLAGSPARDDAAMLFIRIDELGRAAAPQRYEWDFDARNEQASRRVKRAMLWRLPREAQSTAEMIFGELISNVARHTPGHARLSLESDDGQATLSVFDYGRPFELSTAAPDALAEGGRGLMIISAITLDFAVERTLHGNCVRATLTLNPQLS